MGEDVGNSRNLFCGASVNGGNQGVGMWTPQHFDMQRSELDHIFYIAPLAFR